MFNAAVVTVSDKGYAGTRTDRAGPEVARLLEAAGYSVAPPEIVPDEQPIIEAKLIELCDERAVDIIVTTGGTGLSPRDVTPEATIAVCARLVPGIPEAMRAESMRVTPRAMLSRMAAGIRGSTLVINLPGSPKAAMECLNAVIEPVGHGLEVLTGRASECARQ